MKKNDNGKWNLDDLVKNPSNEIFDKKIRELEKDAIQFEKQKKTLEIEMLNKNFYSSNNQKRAQEVNFNLQKVLIQIAEEEKVWEKIVESIELISK